MNILMIEPIRLATPHLETTLEIALDHAERGDSVTLMLCDGQSSGCDWNPWLAPLECIRCLSRQNAAISILSPRPGIRFIHTSALYKTTPRPSIEAPALLSELKKLTFDGFDVGMGVASTMIWQMRDPHFEPGQAKPAVKNLLEQSAHLFSALKHHLRDNAPDRVYTFNGRFALNRAVLRACQQSGVEFMVHERGADLHKYSLVKNAFPHNIAPFVADMREAWRLADDKTRDTAATAFYKHRVAGKIQSWYSYVDKQESSRLPPDWVDDRYNVVIFDSSEDEFAAIGDEWINPVYATQVEGISRILRDLADLPNTHVYLRMHPHLERVNNSATAAIKALSAPIFTLLGPADPTSTYALMAKANVVITFGSTAGIEAAYMGRPSILAGMSFYRELGSVYTPASHEELIALVKSRPPPLPKQGALMYGFYLQTFGIPFKRFSPTGVHAGTFSGRAIRPSNLFTWLEKHPWKGTRIFTRFLVFSSTLRVRLRAGWQRKRRGRIL